MKTIIFLLSLFCLLTVHASRQFAKASTQYIDLNTTVGAFETNNSWSVVCDVLVRSNISGVFLGKSENSSNFRGWDVFSRAGTSSPTFAFNLRNDAAAAKRIVVCTTTEFPTNVWHRVVFTYGGGGNAASMTIRVDGANQALTTISDTLAGSTIANSVAAQIGCVGGVGAPGILHDGFLRRVLLYNVVLSGADLTAVEAGTSVPTTGLQLWQEFGPFNDGVTFVADWSGNANVGFVTGATYSTTDPTITDLTPDLGITGGKTLSGPLTKTTPQPMLQNLGWIGGANNGQGDQIGPGYIYVAGVQDYRGWFENTTGGKLLDAANQTGPFDYDTPMMYATSTNGYNWNIQNQSVSTLAIISVTNIHATAGFRAAAKGETSLQTVLYDPDDHVWKTWIHAGNNSGTRQLYYLICTNDPAVAGNWYIQNSSNPVIPVGAGGSWDDTALGSPVVVRVSSSLMIGIYVAWNSAIKVQLGRATSTDRGLTWTKDAGNPVLAVGAAGQWDAGAVYAGSFFYDPDLKLYGIWYGGQRVTADGKLGVGFAYSSDSITWTRGVFNPVYSSKDATSSQNAFEYIIATCNEVYQDGDTYRLMIRADNGVSGPTGFRGRLEGVCNRIVKPPYRFFGM